MKLYLAHPYQMNELVRDWEVHAESMLDVELVNPFYDQGDFPIGLVNGDTMLQSEVIEALNAGQISRHMLAPRDIIHKDLAAIADADGVVVILNGKLSMAGSLMEMVYAKMLGKKVIGLCLGDAQSSPWIRGHLDDYATNWLSLNMLIVDLKGEIECG